MKVIVKNAVLFTPSGQVEGDCLIDSGRIAQLGQVADVDAEVIDAKGKWLWPGAIDAHVHLRTPGVTHKEDWVTGSAAAAAGGVTCAFDMPNTSPSTITAALWHEKVEIVGAQSRINYGLFFGATATNVEEALKVRDDVPGLKIFMASSTGDLLVDQPEDLHRVFSQYDGQICVHAESEERLNQRHELYKHRDDVQVHSIIRDPEAAKLGVEFACALANKYGRNLHVLHVSTKAEIDALNQGRADRTAQQTHQITGEACPHHLFMNVDAYEQWGNFVKMNPPLRIEDDRLATWAGLRDGSLQMVATDHAPHLIQEKQQPYWQAPSGLPGIQTMLPLLLDAAHQNLCTYEQVLQWVCHAPASIYRLQDRGRLVEGAWADLVLIDPKMTRSIVDEAQFSKCGWSPWRGRQVVGWPVKTWVNGQLVFERLDSGKGRIVTDQPVGQLAQFER